MGLVSDLAGALVFGSGDRALVTLIGRATEARASSGFVAIGTEAECVIVSAPDVAFELKLGVGPGWSEVWVSAPTDMRETHVLRPHTQVWGLRLVPGVLVSGRAVASATSSRAHRDFLRATRHDDRAVEAMRVAEHVLSVSRVDDRVRVAMEAADRADVTSVEALADLTRTTPRHLGRVFARTLGIAPKRALAVLRLRRALGLARARDVSWGMIAAAAGYADQSHLGRDFRALLGASPEAFLRAMRAA
jgi:AraC-like DNA-binding protein